MGYRLGVDLGTTFTAAATDDGSGPQMLGLGNRALQVPSVLFLLDDGSFLYGEPADRRGSLEPARAVREFKRRFGDTVPILVAGQPFSPQTLTARLLSFVVASATERLGGPPDEVVLTHPASWGGYKRELVDQVVALSDLPAVLTCTEPEAAATQYASRAALATGARIAVYDLGGGTFDVCVLQRHESGFSIIGEPEGIEHLGGIDFDEAVFQHVVRELGDDVGRLSMDDPAATSALSRLRRDCVEAKEALSNDVEAVIGVNLPGLATTVRLTRPELESQISPGLRESIAATRRALRSAGTTAEELAAVVLVGGSSRIPLVSQLLETELGVATAVDTHPKHDIALGAVQFHPRPAGSRAPLPPPTLPSAVTDWPSRETPDDPVPAVPETAAASGTAAASAPRPTSTAGPAPEPDQAPTDPAPDDQATRPVTPPPADPPPGPPAPPAAGRPGSRRPPRVVVAAAALLVVGGLTGAILLLGGDTDPPPEGTSGPTASSAAVSPTATTSPSSPSSTAAGLPDDAMIVPIDLGAGDGLDLYEVSSRGGSSQLIDLGADVSTAGDQELPSVSPDHATLVFLNGDQLLSLPLGPDPGGAIPLFSALPVDGLTCTGRAAWSPSGRIALACGPGGGRVVLVGDLDAGSQVAGDRLQPVPGSERERARSITYTADEHIVVTDELSAERGLYRIPASGGSWERLTAGPDQDAVAAPAGDDIAFQREGDLYLVDPDGDTDCEAVGPPPAAAPFKVCRLTTTADFEHHPVWSWDGSQIAFLTSEVEDSEFSLVAIMDVADPTDPRVLTEGPPVRMSPLAWARR